MRIYSELRKSVRRIFGRSIKMSERDCEFCTILSRALTTEERVYRHFGSEEFYQLFDSGCPGHTPLFQHVLGYIPPGSKVISIGLWNDHVYDSLMQVWYSPGWRKTRDVIYFTIVKEHNEQKGREGSGIRLNSKWIDLEVVRGWQRKCEEEHDNQCENPWNIALARPAWLIDATKDCLVHGDVVAPGTGYIALSYRWDNANNFKVDAKMLPKLVKAHSLQLPEIRDCLSPIISDVLQLASGIGERYVWIDALCIVHDDPESTAKQLDLMGAIYASASFTIIATDGDAKYGLTGIEGVTRPRVTTQERVSFAGDRSLLVSKKLPSYKDNVAHSTYATRAWTYQEYYLSSRKLIFTGGEIFWECSCAEWHEDCIAGPSHSPDANPAALGYADMGAYKDLVTGYSLRSLTYDEDAPAAIAGMLAIFSRSFNGGFIYGLPEMYFDIALTWSSVKPLRRRKPSGRSTNSKSDLPSWSWIGWNGQLSYSNIDYNVKYIIPVTTWYAMASPGDTANARRINANWFGMRPSFYVDESQPLPEGWSRDKYGSRHARYPSHLFEYPSPTTEISIDTAVIVPPQMPYLFCQTTRVIARGYYLSIEDPGTYPGIVVDFGTIQRPVKFLLRPDDRDESFFPVSTPNTVVSIPIELVAICAENFDGKHLKESLHYFALWIEWVDGVAYRKGIAYDIPKKHWDNHPTLEKVDLILG